MSFVSAFGFREEPIFDKSIGTICYWSFILYWMLGYSYAMIEAFTFVFATIENRYFWVAVFLSFYFSLKGKDGNSFFERMRFLVLNANPKSY
jgi:hypothetical protein